LFSPKEGMCAIRLNDIDSLRRFNRFYTSFLGILRRSYLRSGFSLAEVRVLYEISETPGCAASDILCVTGLDRGYLSRILARLCRERLAEKQASPSDARVKRLFLTERGREMLGDLTEKARVQARETLEVLPGDKRRDLLAAMRTIMDILPEPEEATPREADD